jgi:hypothetical protein
MLRKRGRRNQAQQKHTKLFFFKVGTLHRGAGPKNFKVKANEEHESLTMFPFQIDFLKA